MVSVASNKGGYLELLIFRAQSVLWPCQIEKDGVPVNLTSAVFTTEIVDRLSKTVVSVVTTNVTDAALGKFAITMTPLQTTALPERKDMEWRCSYQIGGVVKGVFYGPVKVVNGSGS